MIYDGNKLDITDYFSNRFLSINSCGYQNTPIEFSVIRKNGNKNYHIVFVADGNVEVFHKGKSFVLGQGSLVIYAPNEKQFYKRFANSMTLWCHFSGTAVNEILESCNIKSGVYFFKQYANISESFANMIRNYNLPMRSNYAITFLLELLFDISSAIEKMQEKDNKKSIIPILSYININYNKNISLKLLAKKFGYSKSRLSHIFSAATNTTPIKYQKDIRLKTAAEMLLSSNLQVAEIATSCGFEDALYFSKLFKKRYGTSPSEFRNKHE